MLPFEKQGIKAPSTVSGDSRHSIRISYLSEVESCEIKEYQNWEGL